jgi:hypothetical protein
VDLLEKIKGHDYVKNNLFRSPLYTASKGVLGKFKLDMMKKEQE